MGSYWLEYSSKKTAPALKAFYANDLRRGPNVFARNPAVLEREAEQGNAVIAFNENNEMVAAGIGYGVAGLKEIRCQRDKERGRVVEFGSLLRVDRDKRDPNDPPVDIGFWRFVLIAALEMGIIKHAVPADIVILGVHNHPDTKSMKDYITNWPLNFKEICPSQEFLEEDSKMVNGMDLSDTSHFRAYTPSLVPVAETLLKISKEGVVRDLRAPSAIGYNKDTEVRLDIGELGVEPLLEAIVVYGPSYFKEERSTEKENRIKLSWAEAGRYFRSQADALQKQGPTEAYRNVVKQKVAAQPGGV